MDDLEKLCQAFREMYGSNPRLFRAPGRVNLIGEHTDYNDGFVLPMAIAQSTVVAAEARDDRLVRVRSLNLNKSAEFDLNAVGEGNRGLWLDYVEGVARVLESGGARLRGANLVLLSDVPEGAGLSSSAALEISTGLALTTLSGLNVTRITLALAGQKAEHEYVGTKSGIMDQYTSALARKGHALLIDCRTLEAAQIPLDNSEVMIAICNSNVRHALASSEYNTRRAECERGVELLQQFLPDIKALRDVSVEEFEEHEESLPEPVRRRVRHVVTENDRTLEAVEALRRSDFQRMGQLMFESHESLRADYEVSSAELDALVEIAGSIDGVYGARMTGGGFGGCTVNLVRRASLEQFREIVSREYHKRMNLKVDIYVAEASDGAQEIEIEDQA